MIRNLQSAFINTAFVAMATVAPSGAFSQQQTTSFSTEATKKADDELEKKASEWVNALQLANPSKQARVKEIVLTHLKAVRNWHNEHPFTTVPAGINPVTGAKLSELDRQIIADSALPERVHQDLMTGLRQELKPEQVEAILDQYTIGKVAFTMKAYREIVPDMTAEEDSVILNNLKLAREQAVDYKNMKEISAIFEIYKTKNEQYLNSNGRSWRKMYSDYVKALKAKKAAEKQKKD